MSKLVALLTLALLAACGADGAPETPTKPGVSVSGQADVGVVGKS